MKLRYDGPIAVSFSVDDFVVPDVEPGTEFDVPNELATAFLQHGHVREVKKARTQGERKSDVNP